MRKVRHKNVVQFIGACTRRPNLCIVVEYMSGGSVYDYMRKVWTTTPDLAFDMCSLCTNMPCVSLIGIVVRLFKVECDNPVKFLDLCCRRGH